MTNDVFNKGTLHPTIKLAREPETPRFATSPFRKPVLSEAKGCGQLGSQRNKTDTRVSLPSANGSRTKQGYLLCLPPKTSNHHSIYILRVKDSFPTLTPTPTKYCTAARLRRTFVAHGLRSLGSTTLNEQGFNPDAIEAALSHADDNEIRRAYNRSDYYEQRVIMMSWWSNHIEQASQEISLWRAALKD